MENVRPCGFDKALNAWQGFVPCGVRGLAVGVAFIIGLSTSFVLEAWCRWCAGRARRQGQGYARRQQGSQDPCHVLALKQQRGRKILGLLLLQVLSRNATGLLGYQLPATREVPPP